MYAFAKRWIGDPYSGKKRFIANYPPPPPPKKKKKKKNLLIRWQLHWLDCAAHKRKLT